MSFDLKRTYFGLASFVVLMVAFIAGLSLLGAIAGVVVLSPVPLAERYPPGFLERPTAPPPDKGLGTPTAVPAQGGQKEPVSIEDWELRGAREQLATSLAAIVVALPIWAFHWRRFRKLATEANAFLLYRIYAYAAMVVTLVTMIMAGGDLLRQPVLAALGGLDLSTLYARLSLTRGVVGSAGNLVWAFAVWWYHWRVVETAPKG